MLFDLDFRKAKKIEGKSKNELNSFKWVGFIYLVCIGSWMVILLVNWKVALSGVAVYYASAFIPLPQIIGRFFVSLFKPKEDSPNITSQREKVKK